MGIPTNRALRPRRPAVRNDIATFVGIDVGDTRSVLFALDRQGRRVAFRKVDTDEEGLDRGLKDLPTPVRVALEVGTHSPWMSAFLTEQGYEVVVGNARKLRLIYGATNKQDHLDAEKLARLARADVTLLHPVHHRTRAAQADLAVVRARAHLVAMRTGAVTLVRGMVKSFGGRLRSCATESFPRVAAEEVPVGLRPALAPVLEVIAELTRLIQESDVQLKEMARDKYPKAQALLQVHGVGTLTALSMILTLEDPGRFRRSRDVGPALGLVPRRDQSGDVDKQLSITKTGDPYLRVLLVEAAHTAMSPKAPPSDLKSFGERIASQGGKRGRKRAVTAVARKLAVLLHRLWVTQARYIAVRKSAA